MVDLEAACQQLVDSGQAERVLGQAIHLIVPIDQAKLEQVRESYAKSFNRKCQARLAEERRAFWKYQDFQLTY